MRKWTLKGIREAQPALDRAARATQALEQEMRRPKGQRSFKRADRYEAQAREALGAALRACGGDPVCGDKVMLAEGRVFRATRIGMPPKKGALIKSGGSGGRFFRGLGNTQREQDRETRVAGYIRSASSAARAGSQAEAERLWAKAVAECQSKGATFSLCAKVRASQAEGGPFRKKLGGSRKQLGNVQRVRRCKKFEFRDGERVCVRFAKRAARRCVKFAVRDGERRCVRFKML